MATSAQLQWPSPRRFVSAYAQNLMAADKWSPAQKATRCVHRRGEQPRHARFPRGTCAGWTGEARTRSGRCDAAIAARCVHRPAPGRVEIARPACDLLCSTWSGNGTDWLVPRADQAEARRARAGRPGHRSSRAPIERDRSTPRRCSTTRFEGTHQRAPSRPAHLVRRRPQVAHCATCQSVPLPDQRVSGPARAIARTRTTTRVAGSATALILPSKLPEIDALPLVEERQGPVALNPWRPTR
jgi:hypothetical protein